MEKQPKTTEEERKQQDEEVVSSSSDEEQNQNDQSQFTQSEASGLKLIDQFKAAKKGKGRPKLTQEEKEKKQVKKKIDYVTQKQQSYIYYKDFSDDILGIRMQLSQLEQDLQRQKQKYKEKKRELKNEVNNRIQNLQQQLESKTQIIEQRAEKIQDKVMQDSIQLKQEVQQTKKSIIDIIKQNKAQQMLPKDSQDVLKLLKKQ